MTRDGTVGRPDATERSLALQWDFDPVRMMRPRFAGLHQGQQSVRTASTHPMRARGGEISVSAAETTSEDKTMTQAPGPVLDYERTLILAIELSNRSWVLAAQIPGLPGV